MKELDFKVEITPTNPIVQVDDDQAAINLVNIYFKKSDLTCPFQYYTSGSSFFEYLEAVESDSTKIPALVLLDINMPGMDGFEVLEKMRARPKFSQIPVCTMLTSSDHESDRKKALEVGASDYLVKPDDAKEYLEFFNRLAAGS